MIGQRFAFRASVVLGDDDRTALPDAGNVAVEVFKRERQLIGIKAFGAAPELRPLELLDDGLEALDLTVAAVDNNSHLAHQTVQQRRIGRQIFCLAALVSKIGGRRREVSGARRGTASPARAKLLSKAVLENRSHAVGQSSDKRTLLRVGRGQPVGLYAPLHWRGYCAACPSTARLLWVGILRSPLVLSVIKLSAFIDAFRSFPLGLHNLASLESGTHWGLAMRAARKRDTQCCARNNVESIQRARPKRWRPLATPKHS
jgi:hypothetical protein